LLNLRLLIKVILMNFLAIAMRRLCGRISLYSLVALCFSVGLRAASPPNIILITLDTTRADRMGFLGSTRGLTPNLDQIARRSTVFSRAYAVVPLTTASHATILTGTFPEFNGVNDFGKPLPSDVPYLPELLRQGGYRTAAFVGSLVLDPIGGTAPGFDRGFDVYDARFRTRRRGEDRYQTLERRGMEVVAHAVKWLNQRPRGPFFLWVHLYDAHDPYDPPAPYSTRYAASLYDGEIAYADACVGKLIAALRQAGVYDSALIAVMADHGEALGEHGEETHGIFLYDETVHVPLLFKLPTSVELRSGAPKSPSPRSAIPKSTSFASAHPTAPPVETDPPPASARSFARRVESRASLADITPTILEIAGQPLPAAVQGQSLAKLIMLRAVSAHPRDADASAVAGTADRPAYSETDYPHRAFGWSSLRSLRSGKYLFVAAPLNELYDQSVDFAATRNLSAKSPAITDTLAAQVDDFHRQLGSAHLAAAAATDAQQAEQLSALGYVTADSAAKPIESKQNGADPKDRIETANLMHDALMEVEDGRYEEAVPQLQRVLEQEPQMAVAEMQLGIAFARLKKPAEALPLLRSALKRQADSGMAHYEYGLALFDTGDLQSAAPEFAFAVEHAPRWADAHFSLAAVYARIDRVPEAMTELDTALALNPSHYRANLLRGRILSLQGRPSDALANLRQATQVEPRSVEAHSFLADAYTQLGQQEDAARERSAAEQMKSALRP
jgi:choline-sulfatase